MITIGILANPAAARDLRRLVARASSRTVAKIELDEAGLCVQCWLEHEKGIRCPCPTCGQDSVVYDHAPEQTWRHLNTCDYLSLS